MISRLKQKGMAPITYEQGQALAKKLGAITYVETSALTSHGVVKCFETVVASSFMASGGVVKQKFISNDKKCNVQ